MISKYAEKKLKEIEQLFGYFESLRLDEELESHIAKYMTVLISGIYESIIEDFINEFIKNTTRSKEINKFVSEIVSGSFRNPKFQTLVKLLSKFSGDWVKQIRQVKDENKEALTSIINHKNLIAHGDSSTITFNQIKEYYYKSKKIIEELDLTILSSQLTP